MRSPLRVVPVALLALACRSADSSSELPRLDAARGAEAELREALALELGRSAPAELVAHLASPSSVVRRRAALALGRHPGSGDAEAGALERALADPEPAVRGAAAFALGLLGEGPPGWELVTREDADATVRARCIEALGRRADEDAQTALLLLLDVQQRLSLGERIELVTAPHRWDVRAPTANGVDSRLVELLHLLAAEDDVRARLERTPEIELPWRALFTLQRRDAARRRALESEDDRTKRAILHEGLALAEDVFRFWSRSAEPRARIFAVRGLGTLESNVAVRGALCIALADRDWRVAVEAARGLARTPDAAGLEALVHALGHDSAHVRAGAYEALGAYEEFAERLRIPLERAVADPSRNVEAAAIVAAARLFGDDCAAALELKRLKPDAVVRAGAAEAARHLAPRFAVPMLRELARDADLRVAGVALESLGALDDPDARETLLATLRLPDPGLRLGALLALEPTLASADVPALAELFRTTRGGGIADEVRFGVLNAAARLDGDAATELLREGARAPHAHTRAVAVRALRERGVEPPPMPTAPLPADVPDELLELADSDVPLFVRVDTTRGPLLFELFPREAPLHVQNLLALAARDHYDGLVWHRVVSDFVVQGGDVRGDGNGGTTWFGGGMPNEFTPRKTVRGSLGMPRNEDPDSGGSQLFVTHRATPHLDGRYTLFGELRDGFDVLDRLEVGDRILDVVRVAR